MNPEGLVVREEQEAQQARLAVTGDILISNAGGLQRHINAVIERGASDVTLDLTAVQYMDSFGIGVVVQTQSALDAQQGSRFRVVANEQLIALFHKSHLDGYIKILSAEEVRR